ncbi:MAG: Holliday junction DNA helicase RuvB C-terminal domain-containing protein, partial [Victivallaceae bacterium]
IANAALAMYDIDNDGLDSMDNRLLEIIVNFYHGGPVGVKTLAVAVGEEERTIEDVYEPYLIQEGFLMRTAQGRVAAPRAWQKLGLKPPSGKMSKNDHPELF